MFALHKMIAVGFPGALESQVAFASFRAFHRAKLHKPLRAKVLKSREPERAGSVVKSIAAVLSGSILNVAALKYAGLLEGSLEDESIMNPKYYAYQAPCFH